MTDERRMAIILASIAFLALSLRAFPYLQVAGDEPLFTGNDTYIHMWRVERTIEGFPRVPRFDAYHGYPEGSWDTLPPLFTLVVATLAMALGGGSPDRGAIHLAGMLFPPLAGLVAVLLAFLLGRRLFGRESGLYAALVLATMTASVWGTILGRPDHHCLTPALSLAILLALSSLDDRRTGAVLLSGALLGAAVLIWLGSLLFPCILTLALALRAMAYALDGRDARGVLAAGAASLLVATAVVWPVFDTGRGLFSFRQVSLFHPTIMLILALTLGALWTVLSLMRGERTRRLVAGACICIGGGLALVSFAAGGLSQNIAGVLGFLTVEDEFGPVVPDEARPLIYYDGGLHLARGAFLLGTSLPVGLAGLVLLFRRERDWGAFLLAVWCTVFIALTLYQRRVANELSAPLAVVCGYALTEARGRLGLRPGTAGHALLILILLVPAAHYSLRLRMEIPDDDVLDLYHWIAESTPPMTGAHPDYGIMCDWGMGYRVLYLGRRPPLSDNGFCRDEKGLCGLNDSLTFYFSRSEREAAAIMERLEGRYVITTERNLADRITRGHIAYLGRDVDQLYEPVEQGDGTVSIRLTRAFLALTNTRLHTYDGGSVDGSDIPAMKRFRLAYESPTTGQVVGSREIMQYKVFEHVPGARLVGDAPPGATVTAEVEVGTLRGRRFTYFATTVADSSGRFALRVPYATDDTPYRTGPMGPYTVHVGESAVRVHVAERAVQNGLEVRIG